MSKICYSAHCLLNNGLNQFRLHYLPWYILFSISNKRLWKSLIAICEHIFFLILWLTETESKLHLPCLLRKYFYNHFYQYFFQADIVHRVNASLLWIVDGVNKLLWISNARWRAISIFGVRCIELSHHLHQSKLPLGHKSGAIFLKCIKKSGWRGGGGIFSTWVKVQNFQNPELLKHQSY